MSKILYLPDEAVVTGHAVIPLPKLPSSFTAESPASETEPASYVLSPPAPDPTPIKEAQSSPMSTLERYRTRTRPAKIQMDFKNEEKCVLDKTQPEVLNKQVNCKNKKIKKLKVPLCRRER